METGNDLITGSREAVTKGKDIITFLNMSEGDLWDGETVSSRLLKVVVTLRFGTVDDSNRTGLSSPAGKPHTRLTAGSDWTTSSLQLRKMVNFNFIQRHFKVSP